MGCSASIAKIILFVFNICFFIFGAVSLGVGIWVAVGKNELFRFVNLIDSKVAENSSKEQIENLASQNGLIMAAAYVLIGIGVFTLIVGFCGCCGAMKESPMLLNIYSFLVALVLIIEITAAVLAGVFRSRIIDDSERAMLNLQDKFFEGLPDYVSNQTSGKAAVTYLINFMQISLECCGVTSLNDISNSTSWKASNRMWDGKEIVTPVTCCKFKTQELKSDALKPTFNWNNTIASLEDPNCPFTAASASQHSKTCAAGVKAQVERYAVTIIAVCVSIALIEILGILFSCCLVRALRDE